MDKFFRIPFASSGDRTAIPDAVDVNGFVSYTQGYGFDYQRQKSDPAAKNIERDKMNDLFFEVTTAISEQQSKGIPDFITPVLNGGTAYSYDIFALVRYDDGDGDRVYQSIAATNTALPTDATKWSLLPVQAIGTPVASATTLDLSGVVGDYVHITGSTGPISAITLREGAEITVVFDSTPTLVNSANLILPGGVNLVATAGLTATFRGEASSVVRCSATSASGLPVASTAEAQAGTDNATVITPLRMREGFNASGSAPVYACRAWVNFNGTGTVAIRASGNVSSITDNGTGDYTINFSTAMPDINYAADVVNSPNSGSSQYAAQANLFAAASSYTRIAPTTSAFRFATYGNNYVAFDPVDVMAHVFR